MYYKILLFLCFCSSISYGQGLKEKFEKDLCKCLNEAEEIKRETSISCLETIMRDNKEEFEKLLDKDSPLSAYEQGRILGREMYADMQVTLVQSCDVYYHFFQRTRKASIVFMQEQYTEQAIKALDEELAEHKSIDLMLERGNAYFAKKEFQKAKEQYYECLSLDSSHVKTIFFLGWVQETEGNYQEAIESYKKASRIAQRREFLLFAELAKRKSTE